MLLIYFMTFFILNFQFSMHFSLSLSLFLSLFFFSFSLYVIVETRKEKNWKESAYLLFIPHRCRHHLPLLPSHMLPTSSYLRDWYSIMNWPWYPRQLQWQEMKHDERMRWTKRMSTTWAIFWLPMTQNSGLLGMMSW